MNIGWIFQTRAVIKGTAISKIQEKYGISYEEVHAFGDYLNDYEMMKTENTGRMLWKNSHPQLKEIYELYGKKSSSENGVVEAARAYFK